MTIDADLSHNPKEIPLLIYKLKSNDFVIGSRYVSGGKSDYTGYRNLVSRLANKLCRFILNMPFNEFTTSFRIYNDKCLKVLKNASLKSDGYSSQIEFFYYVYMKGLKCNENNTARLRMVFDKKMIVKDQLNIVKDQHSQTMIMYFDVFATTVL